MIIEAMATHKETFSKSERLCSRKAIDSLFENGKSFYCHPYVIVWGISMSEIPFPAQVAFSVSKRSFKLAVTRNLIKRRTREAYRKNKSELYEILDKTGSRIVFAMIYKGNSVPDYGQVESSVKDMIKMFRIKLSEPEPKC